MLKVLLKITISDIFYTIQTISSGWKNIYTYKKCSFKSYLSLYPMLYTNVKTNLSFQEY